MSKKKGKTPQPAAKKMTASAPKMEALRIFMKGDHSITSIEIG